MYFTEFSADKVNELLQTTWHLNLFRFAQILATCASGWLQRPEMLNLTKAKLKRQRKLLIALKKYILKRLEEIDSVTFFVDKNLPEEELINQYKLTDFFERYFNPLMAQTNAMLGAHKPKQGAHIAKRSVLAASWGSLIYKHGQKMNWALLADLYEWFWERLRTSPYYRAIKPPDDLVSYLAVQYHRHKKNPDSIYCVETYGQQEFLTILASKGSFVDRNFAYVDDILINLHGKKRVPQNLSWEHELAFEGNDLADFLFFSASLYTKRRISNVHQYPLIIFPDRSWYSPEF